MKKIPILKILNYVYLEAELVIFQDLTKHYKSTAKLQNMCMPDKHINS